jgi:hypothetical protein
MNTGEMNYGNLKLLSEEIAPSRYLFCMQDSAKMISWQITMADGSVRDILFDEMNGESAIEAIGSKIFFNAKSMPMAGFQNFNLEGLEFRKLEENDSGIVFVPEDGKNLPCTPRVTYKLSELYFHIEIALTNNGSMPMYWRPAIHFFVNLPWTSETPIEKYIIKTLAKKRLRISDSMCVINSVKAAEKTSLELLNDGAIGFTQLQDSKVWVGTSNEEEGLSFIFANRTQKSVFVLRKTVTSGKTEVAFLCDIPSEADDAIANGDMKTYMPIAPGGTEIFSAEISAY